MARLFFVSLTSHIRPRSSDPLRGKTKLPDNMKGSVDVEQSEHIHTAGGCVCEISNSCKTKLHHVKQFFFLKYLYRKVENCGQMGLMIVLSFLKVRNHPNVFNRKDNIF